MEVQSNQYGFRKDFIYEGASLSIHVIPFLIATEKDRKAYHLKDGDFLVHLFEPTSFKSFSVFINDKLEWDSNVSKLILDDKDLIERIGFLIDNYYS